jgi:hypothetical protein
MLREDVIVITREGGTIALLLIEQTIEVSDIKSAELELYSSLSWNYDPNCCIDSRSISGVHVPKQPPHPSWCGRANLNVLIEQLCIVHDNPRDTLQHRLVISLSKLLPSIQALACIDR